MSQFSYPIEAAIALDAVPLPLGMPEWGVSMTFASRDLLDDEVDPVVEMHMKLVLPRTANLYRQSSNSSSLCSTSQHSRR